MTAAPANTRPPLPPRCDRRKVDGKGVTRRCPNDAKAAWVKGEFGRSPMNLCLPCVTALRGIGWNVRWQIEGDNPPPLESDLTGKAGA